MTKDRKELHKLAYGILSLVKEFQYAQSRRSDLDRVTFEILMLVRQRGQIRLTDIANKLEFNPSSITRRIQSLKQSGHIRVENDPKDLRTSLVRITDSGEGVLMSFLENSMDGLERILTKWNDDEIRATADHIWRLAGSMSDWRNATDKTKGASGHDVRE